MPIIHREDGVPPSKSQLVTMGGAFNDTINSFATHTKTFTPPRGKKWQIIAMRLKKGAPVGAAMGAHGFYVEQAVIPMVIGESVFGSLVEWNTNMWTLADSLQRPATEGGAIAAMHAIIADADHPLTVDYNNLTDVANSTLGEITIHVLESPII